MKPNASREMPPRRAPLERRAFMLKAGTALSATLACATAAAAVAPASHEPDARTDAEAIRDLNRRYGEALNERRYEDIVRLFDEDAAVSFNGGVFLGRRGVRRLYVDHFGGHFAGAVRDHGEPVHALMLCVPGEPQNLEIAADRHSAQARFRRMMQVEATIVSSSSLVAMAREQGQGVARWWEDGAYDVKYTRTRGQWRIRRLAYRPASPSVPAPLPFAATPHAPSYRSRFPDHPHGPDRLLKEIAHDGTSGLPL